MLIKDRVFVCENCGKDFQVGYCLSKNQTPKYCNRRCYSTRIVSQETKEKQSNARKGRVPWNKGINMWEGKRHPRGTLGKKMKRKGTKFPEWWKEKMSKAHKGIELPHNQGANHWNWQGGKSKITDRLRKSIKYKQWREKIFKRDDYTCQMCNIKSGQGKRVTLHADHIKAFSKFPSLRFDINNDRALCIDCHRKTDNYGSKINRKVA